MHELLHLTKAQKSMVREIEFAKADVVVRDPRVLLAKRM